MEVAITDKNYFEILYICYVIHILRIKLHDRVKIFNHFISRFPNFMFSDFS